MIDKLKELSKDTAIYGISTVIGRLFGFILIPFLTQFFTRDQMGVYGNIYAYIAFLNIFYIYGMDAAFLKYFSVAKKEDERDIFSTPYIFVGITSLLFTLILLYFRTDIAAAMKVPEHYWRLLYYMIFILLFDTLALIPFAHLRLQRKAGKFAWIKITNISVNLLANIVLVWGFRFDIDAIFISNLIASALAFLLLLPEIMKYLHFKIDAVRLKRMLNFALPYLPAALASVTVQVIDRPILTYLTDDATVGVYTTNYKLGISMMLYVGMFQYAWQPFFLNNAKEKNAKEIFARVLTLFMIVGSILVVGISLFVNDIASFEFMPGKTLIAQRFLEGLPIVPIILLSYLFHGMYINFTAGIFIQEKTKYFPVVTITGAIVNVAFNLWAIPKWGIMGAAYATLASYMVNAFLLYVFAQKFYPIKYEYRKIIMLFVLIAIAGAAYYYLLGTGQLYFFMKIIILFVFTAFLFVFKILQKNEIVTTYKILMGKR